MEHNWAANKQKSKTINQKQKQRMLVLCRTVHVLLANNNNNKQTNQQKWATNWCCMGVLCRKVHVIRAANRQTRAGQTNKTE